MKNLFIFLSFCLVGCVGEPVTRVVVPSSDPTQPAITYESTGAAENPSTLTIEEAPQFWLETEAGKGKTDFSFPAGSKSFGGRKISVTGPKAFQPPAPATPKENAEGNAVYVAMLCVLLGVVAAGALAYFGFRHEAFWAVAGGFACGAAVRFISNEAAMYIAAGIALLIGVLVWAWFRVRDRVPEEHGGRLKVDPAKSPRKFAVRTLRCGTR